MPVAQLMLVTRRSYPFCVRSGGQADTVTLPDARHINVVELGPIAGGRDETGNLGSLPLFEELEVKIENLNIKLIDAK